mgnify:CR=1 FL=1
MKTITVEDYQEAGKEFWPKYFYTAKELGEGVEPEQVLKVMESLASVAMRQKAENKIGPFGFNKKGEVENTDTV